MSTTSRCTVTMLTRLLLTTALSYADASEFTCKMDMKHPFNASNPSHEFVVDCTAAIPWETYTWIAIVFGGSALLYVLISCCFR